MWISLLRFTQCGGLWWHQLPPHPRVFGLGTRPINGELVVGFISLQTSYQAGLIPYPNGAKHNRSTPDLAINADPQSGWTIYFNKVLYTSQFGGTSCATLRLRVYSDYSIYPTHRNLMPTYTITTS